MQTKKVTYFSRCIELANDISLEAGVPFKHEMHLFLAYFILYIDKDRMRKYVFGSVTQYLEVIEALKKVKFDVSSKTDERFMTKSCEDIIRFAIFLSRYHKLKIIPSEFILLSIRYFKNTEIRLVYPQYDETHERLQKYLIDYEILPEKYLLKKYEVIYLNLKFRFSKKL